MIGRLLRKDIDNNNNLHEILLGETRVHPEYESFDESSDDAAINDFMILKLKKGQKCSPKDSNSFVRLPAASSKVDEKINSKQLEFSGWGSNTLLTRAELIYFNAPTTMASSPKPEVTYPDELRALSYPDIQLVSSAVCQSRYLEFFAEHTETRGDLTNRRLSDIDFRDESGSSMICMSPCSDEFFQCTFNKAGACISDSGCT